MAGEAPPIRVIKALVEGLRPVFRGMMRHGFSGSGRDRERDSLGEGFEETPRTAALPTAADRRSALKRHWDWLLELRRREDDLTPDASRASASHAQRVSRQSMLSRFFAAGEICFK